MARGRQEFRVEGLRELQRNLAELPKATAKNVCRRILIKAAEPFISAARASAPRLTGALAASIHFSTRLSPRQQRLARREAKLKNEKYFTEVHAGASALPHAHLVEYGTFKMAPRPFMRPAWDANKFGAMDTIVNDLGDEIMKAAKRMEAKLARARRRR